MAINFVIEDGTGKTDATSYATVAYFREYWENKGVSHSANTDEDIQIWLNEATEFIDNRYNFEGVKTYSTQALSWPRANVTDSEGYYLSSTSINSNIQKATCYLAGQIKTSPLYEVSSNIRSESYGGVSITYSGNTQLDKYKLADDYLKSYIVIGVTLKRVN